MQFQNVSYLVIAPVVNVSFRKSANVAAPTAIVAPIWEARGARVSISSSFFKIFFLIVMFFVVLPFNALLIYFTICPVKYELAITSSPLVC